MTRRLFPRAITTNDFQENWAELKRRGFGGALDAFPYVPVEERSFSDILEDKAWREQPCRDLITTITPTGDRPLAFALCQQWIKNQTRQPDQWIVIDDGKTPMKSFIPMEYVRREPQSSDSEHTLHLNLKAAVPLIKGDKIIIIEDDEYYAPNYIKEISARLNQHEVVGIMRSKYYHIFAHAYFEHGNMGHASLAQTSFRSSFLSEFRRFLENGSRWLDTQLWEKFDRYGQTSRGIVSQRSMPFIQAQAIQNERTLRDGRALLFADIKEPLYLGIKGLPGRAGIGIGHKSHIYSQHDSGDMQVLKKWVPQDYQVYLDVLSGKLTTENARSYFLEEQHS